MDGTSTPNSKRRKTSHSRDEVGATTSKNETVGSFLIRVDINQVEKGQYTVRERHGDEYEVGLLREKFLQGNYGEFNNFISVTALYMFRRCE